MAFLASGPYHHMPSSPLATSSPVAILGMMPCIYVKTGTSSIALESIAGLILNCVFFVRGWLFITIGAFREEM